MHGAAAELSGNCTASAAIQSGRWYINRRCTVTAYIAQALSISLNKKGARAILATGGGAKNAYLIELLDERTSAELVIPNEEIIDFKEALIFAFLGLLRLQGKNNCLSAVTGAKTDNIGGAIYDFNGSL